MPRPNNVITPKTMIAKEWQNPRKLANVCSYFCSPSKDLGELDSADRNILSYVGKPGSSASLTKIMRQLEHLYSPLSVRKLVTLGYVSISEGDGDLVLTRTEKQCPQ